MTVFVDVLCSSVDGDHHRPSDIGVGDDVIEHQKSAHDPMVSMSLLMDRFVVDFVGHKPGTTLGAIANDDTATLLDAGRPVKSSTAAVLDHQGSAAFNDQQPPVSGPGGSKVGKPDVAEHMHATVAAVHAFDNLHQTYQKASRHVDRSSAQEHPRVATGEDTASEVGASGSAAVIKQEHLAPPETAVAEEAPASTPGPLGPGNQKTRVMRQEPADETDKKTAKTYDMDDHSEVFEEVEGSLADLEAISIDASLSRKKDLRRRRERRRRAVDCKWGNWGSWDDCSKTCGGGKKSRERSIATKADGGAQCTGETKEKEECKTDACPTTTTTKKPKAAALRNRGTFLPLLTVIFIRV